MILLNAIRKDNILTYLTTFEGLNYNKVQALFRKKNIKVNNKKIDKNFILNIGDEIKLYVNYNYFFNIETIFEDENILIVDKPKKLEVITQTRNISLLNLINPNYYVVHRIDFNTEGLVVIAKNENSKLELEKAFKNGEVLKNYITICKNVPKQKSLLFCDYLEKNDGFVKITNTKTNNSKICKTEINLIETNKNYSLLDVSLLTGRTHQIRAHLAFHNLFVLGDDKYGDFKLNKQLNLKSQILKCYKLKFNFNESSSLNYLNNLEFYANTEEINNYFNTL